MEIMAAVFGHEIEHTTSENMTTVVKKGKKAGEEFPFRKVMQ